MATPTNSKSLGELLAVIRKALELYPKTAVEVEKRKKEIVSRNASEFYVGDMYSSLKKQEDLEGEL